MVWVGASNRRVTDCVLTLAMVFLAAGFLSPVAAFLGAGLVAEVTFLVVLEAALVAAGFLSLVDAFCETQTGNTVNKVCST